MAVYNRAARLANEAYLKALVSLFKLIGSRMNTAIGKLTMNLNFMLE